jgi:hypothetical protein
MNLRAVIGMFALSWVLGWSWPASSCGHQDPATGFIAAPRSNWHLRERRNHPAGVGVCVHPIPIQIPGGVQAIGARSAGGEAGSVGER